LDVIEGGSRHKQRDMELIMFKNKSAQISYINEGAMVRMGYIFADKMTVVSYNFNHLQELIDFDSRTEGQLLKSYLVYYKYANGAVSPEMLENNYGSLKKLRNEKGKRKEWIIQQQKLDSNSHRRSEKIPQYLCNI
jgi:hypothetical protein